MKNKKYNALLVLVMTVTGIFNVTAQDLLDLLDDELPKQKRYTQATFKANRVLLGHSVETRKKGVLELVFGTRYWNVPGEELRQTFAADRFSAHFGAQYALTDRLTLGAGFTTFDGIWNGFAKYRLIRQTDDGKNPFGLTLVQGASYFTKSFPLFILPEATGDRFSYVSQAIFARKFTRNFSFQLVPSYLHLGSNEPIGGPNDFFSLGFGGRYKLGNHVSLVSEYHLLFGRNKLETNPDREEGFNLFTLGVNWEVSDLILQFSLTNAKSFDDVANLAVSQNSFNFKPGGLHIGVNATYVIHFNQKKIKRKSVQVTSDQ